jgi:hypothetical protein
VLKSGLQTPELDKELWQTILSGNVFRCIMVNSKKNGHVFVAGQCRAGHSGAGGWPPDNFSRAS